MTSTETLTFGTQHGAYLSDLFLDPIVMLHHTSTRAQHRNIMRHTNAKDQGNTTVQAALRLILLFLHD